MTTLVTVNTVEGVGNNPVGINFMASCIEKAEKHLAKEGFEKVTDSWSDIGYQTWTKKIEANNAFFKESLTYVTVKKYNNFIG